MDQLEKYFDKQERWKKELEQLRAWLKETELVETIKWRMPTYTVNGKNVIGIAGFKNHFGIWFFQGVFLKDKQKLLRNAQEGKTKGMRQMKFDSYDQLNRDTILSYVEEAIANQKANKVVKVERTQTVTLPPELLSAFQKDSALEKQFKGLSLGKQKDYAEYISSAKQEKTKMSRLEKINPMIKAGKGLHDQYKK